MNRKERRGAARETARGGSAAGAAPLDGRALTARGVTLHQMGRLAEAETLYRQASALDPSDPDPIHLLGLVAHQRGENEKAVGLLKRAIALDGRVATYHSNLGEAYRALGRLEEAAASHRAALALRPDLAAARFGLGTALLDLKSYAAASAELQAALDLDPKDADAHVNLGIALFELGNTAAAIAHHEAALALRPDFAEAQLNLGIALHAAGELRKAHAALGRAIRLKPQISESHYQIGRVLATLERYDEATLALKEAARLRPDLPNSFIELGQVLRLRHRTGEAIAAYEQAKALDPARTEPLVGIGLAHLEEGRFEEARHWFALALARDPQSADGHFNMGLSYQLQGRFADAVPWHEKAIALQPDHASAHYHLVTGRKAGEGEARRQEIERVLALPTLSSAQRSALNFALAKIHDDLGNYDAAFRAYHTGNELRKASLYFRPEDFTAYVDRMIAVFSAELFAAKAGMGSTSALPVFIVGMPRSGTTLVEQILASHPQVHGAGELDFLRQIAHDLPARVGSGEGFPECVRALDAAAAGSIAAEHVERLSAYAKGVTRVTDKLPNNFLRLGLIAILFPRSRLIHCVRDPLDTCLSCYFQEFAHGQPFASDLDHLGRYYRDYRRLMAHWHAVLPAALLDVPYEGLVADQEGWSRKLVDFVGLPWDERCLAFYEKERLVRTASFWQVRQPIYASSIGRWRHYASHLAPLFHALGLEPPATLQGFRHGDPESTEKD